MAGIDRWSITITDEISFTPLSRGRFRCNVPKCCVVVKKWWIDAHRNLHQAPNPSRNSVLKINSDIEDVKRLVKKASEETLSEVSLKALLKRRQVIDRVQAIVGRVNRLLPEQKEKVIWLGDIIQLLG